MFDIDVSESDNGQIRETKGNARNNANKSQKKEKNVKSNKMQPVKGYFSEFMDNSTIHGFKYLGGIERPLIEKCFWFIVVCASIYLCATQVVSVYKKWEENPVFIGISQNPIQIWEIPFPAITVCPSYIINKKSGYEFNVTLRSIIDGSETIESWGASFLCREKPFKSIPNITGQNLPKIRIKTGFSTEQIFNGCRFSKNLESSCEYFSPILTRQGLCFSANMLDKNELFHKNAYVPDGLAEYKSTYGWDFDGRNLKINKTHSYPMTAVNSSYLVLKPLNKIGCVGVDKYTIYLHHPTEIPTLRSTSISVDSEKHYNVKIKPKVIISSEALRLYSPKRRRCFFTFESQLHFYKTYSFVNCRMECLANYTLKYCGCVSFFMPRNATTSVCLDNDCPSIAEEKLGESEREISDDLYFKSCNCLPSCTSVTYIADFDAAETHYPLTILEMNIKEEEILSFERNELFGDISFLANCGGLLGLFTGFSLMSLIEIIYFCCFRWVYALAKSYRQK